MRPPDGAALAYRKALRAVVARVVGALERRLFPQLTDLPGPTARADTRDGARSVLADLKRSLLEDDHTGMIRDAAGRVAEANAREFKRVLKIDLRQAVPGVAPTIDKFRRENVNLIESIQTDLLDQVGELVDKAWTAGTRVETLRSQLQERFDVTESRADLIARDQVLKLNSQITRARQTSAGIVEYIWTTSGDERVRERHAELDGQRCRWDAPPVVNEKTGETAHPGEDYQCRCVAMPVLGFLEDPDLDEPL